ncbi:MAG: TetR/AcrR family transcriptional regulator [Ktedonobacteraceae bacterium]|nr:TetR/AcrR family transcriptional regulator [Ktedonobacteraceae bacterium]
MDKQDRRVKRTQNLLAKALIALTLEKGYDAITIRDITQRADVGYATFFRHYHDKDELLQDVLEVVLEELMHVFFASSYQGDPAVDGLLLFRYVQQHSEVIRVLLSSRGSSSLIQRIIEAVTQDVLSRQTLVEGGIVPTEIAAYHLITSSITLVQWWLEHDMPYPPERMGEVYRELVIRPTIGINNGGVQDHQAHSGVALAPATPPSSQTPNN